MLLHEHDPGALSILSIVLSFVFDVFIVVVIFRRVFSNDQPNSETVFGALCIYLLVGFSFASVYGMVAALQPRMDVRLSGQSEERRLKNNELTNTTPLALVQIFEIGLPGY